MTKTVPPPRDGFADALDEARDFAWATPRDHLEVLRALCRAAYEQLESNPNRDAILAYQDPLPAESLRLIEELKARFRAKRG
ncbi:MAG: hypothetical protein HYV07_20935 [Deltaproteobacteria bacterium]|nr:hypothetical protein [Deltaproteobacteria bacterium]